MTRIPVITLKRYGGLKNTHVQVVPRISTEEEEAKNDSRKNT